MDFFAVKLSALFLALLLPLTVKGDFTFLGIESEFVRMASSAGNSLTALEDMENNNVAVGNGALLPPNTIWEFGEPLVDSSGFGFTSGLGTELITVGHLGTEPDSSWALFREAEDSFMAILFGIQVDFVGQPVHAFGIDLQLVLGQPLLVEARDINGNIVFSDEVQSPANFLGFVGDNALGSIRIGSNRPLGDIAFIDNLQMWQPNAIPEPSGLFVFLAGILLMSARRKRQDCSTGIH